jgi:excisionase family DNA binding protein
MPVIFRKLASAPPRPVRTAPTSNKKQPPVPVVAPHQSATDQRCMNVKAAAKYLGVSVWQIRKFFRERDLKPFMIGNKWMVDRVDLDALIERLKAAAS